MLYFLLFDHAKLSNFSTGEKHKIINIALKQSRVDHPIDIFERVLKLIAVALLPSLLFLLLLSTNVAVMWLIVATTFLNIKLAKSEVLNVESYLDSAITEFKNQKEPVL